MPRVNINYYPIFYIEISVVIGWILSSLDFDCCARFTRGVYKLMCVYSIPARCACIIITLYRSLMSHTRAFKCLLISRFSFKLNYCFCWTDKAKCCILRCVNKLLQLIEEFCTFFSLLYVSTLDGKLTALDAALEGQKKWALDFKKQPLLSSNIHRRDVCNNLFIFFNCS